MLDVVQESIKSSVEDDMFTIILLLCHRIYTFVPTLFDFCWLVNLKNDTDFSFIKKIFVRL